VRLNLLSDAHWESKVGKVLDEFSATGYRRIFEERNYGNGLTGITVIFVCQDAALNLKKRVRFDKKENKLYLDVMLDLEQMRRVTHQSMREIIANALFQEVPVAVAKYRISDFDANRFAQDLKNWIEKSLGNL